MDLATYIVESNTKKPSLKSIPVNYMQNIGQISGEPSNEIYSPQVSISFNSSYFQVDMYCSVESLFGPSISGRSG